MNQYFKRALFTFSILSIYNAYPMEKETEEQAIERELSLLEPFSKEPFRYIPQYVYENCNQVTQHKWSRAHFELLKNAVDTITKQRVKLKYPDEKEFIKAVEGYDWIYGLKLIESNYLSKDMASLTLDDFKQINARITRFTDSHKGEFRQENTFWAKKELTTMEWMFLKAIDTLESVESFLEGSPEATGQELEKNPNLILKCNEKGEIAINRIKAWALTWNVLSMLETNLPQDKILHMEEIDVWQQESREVPGNTPDTLALAKWTEKRIHFFPPFHEIEQNLKELFKLTTALNLHPIILAARLWYQLVQIHPWNEANKRTGKVVASLVLLKNGYLPPLILVEDEKEYSQTFIKSFGKKDGHLDFIRLIMRLIDKTQRKFQEEFPS